MCPRTLLCEQSEGYLRKPHGLIKLFKHLTRNVNPVLKCAFSNPLVLYLKTITAQFSVNTLQFERVLSIHQLLKALQEFHKIHSPRLSDLRFYLVTTSMVHNCSYPCSIQRCCVEDFIPARKKQRINKFKNFNIFVSRNTIKICFNQNLNGLSFIYHILLQQRP